MASLLITDTFLPRLGGRENYYHFLFTHLEQEKSVIVTPDLTGDWETFDRQYPLPIHRIPKLSRIWFRLGRIGRWQWFRQLQALVQQYEIDIVHCGVVLPDGLTGWLLWKTLGIPYLVYAHGKEILEHQDQPDRFELMTIALTHARHIISNSHYTDRLIAAQGIPANRRSVIHPGIDPQEWTTPVAESHLQHIRHTCIPAEEQPGAILLSVGRLIERKGQDTMITALPEIRKHHPHTRYVIIGEGPQRSDLEALVRQHHLETAVQFKGEVSLADLRAYYALATLFVMISRQPPGSHEVEGFGIVYLEANACGLAVVAGRSGGIADAVVDGETGYLVDPVDPQAVAEAIVRLLDDPALRQRLATQGQERAVNEFTWKRSSWQLETLLQQIRQTLKPQLLAVQWIRTVPLLIQRFVLSKTFKL